LKDLNKFLVPKLVYSQMWLHLFMDDYHLNYITKGGKNLLTYRGNKNLQFIKKWTNVSHNEINIVKDLMKAFLKFTLS
jgi:hypothetical protein